MTDNDNNNEYTLIINQGSRVKECENEDHYMNSKISSQF